MDARHSRTVHSFVSFYSVVCRSYEEPLVWCSQCVMTGYATINLNVVRRDEWKSYVVMPQEDLKREQANVHP
jgi:hypothetical protein